MADSIEDEVEEVRAQVEERSRQQQRVAVELEVAADTEAEALRRLREEFGAASVEEGEALLAKIDADMRARLAVVRSELDKAEGGES